MVHNSKYVGALHDYFADAADADGTALCEAVAGGDVWPKVGPPFFVCVLAHPRPRRGGGGGASCLLFGVAHSRWAGGGGGVSNSAVYIYISVATCGPRSVLRFCWCSRAPAASSRRRRRRVVFVVWRRALPLGGRRRRRK